jgi:hypothetical protein
MVIDLFWNGSRSAIRRFAPNGNRDDARHFAFSSIADVSE